MTRTMIRKYWWLALVAGGWLLAHQAHAGTTEDSVIKGMVYGLVYSDACPAARTHLTDGARAKLFRALKLYPAETARAQDAIIGEIDVLGKPGVCRRLDNDTLIDAINGMNKES